MARIKELLDSKIIKSDVGEETVLTWRETISYALGRGAQGLSTAMMSSKNINYFMTNLMGIPLEIVSNIRFWCGIWDAFNDPIMGVLVDKTNTADGKMRPYIRIAPIVSAFFTVMLFVGQTGFPDIVKIIWATIAMIGWDMSYTAFDIPMGALAFSITPSGIERTKLYGISSIFRAVIGAMPQVFVIVALMIPYFKENTAPAYTVAAIVAGIGMILFSRPTYRVCQERASYSENEPTVKQCFQLLIQNKPLFMLFLANMAFLLVTVQSAVTTYIAVDLMGNSSYIGALEVAVAPAPFIAGIFVPKLVEKLGPKADFVKIYRACCLIAAAMNLLFFVTCAKPLLTLDAVNEKLSIWVVVLMIIFIAGYTIPLEFKNLLGKEMEAETVDYIEWKTGERAEGIMLSLMSFTGKLTNSASSAIALFVLGICNYVTHGDAIPVAQPLSAKIALFSCITLIPMVGYLLMLIPIKFFGITKEKHTEMLKEIQARRKSDIQSDETEIEVEEQNA